MMPKFHLSYTIKSWLFGIGIEFPAISQWAAFGYYSITNFEIDLYFGPFTLGICFGEDYKIEVIE